MSFNKLGLSFDDALLPELRTYLLVEKDLSEKSVTETLRFVRRFNRFTESKPFILKNCLEYLAYLKEGGKKPSTRANAVAFMKYLYAFCSDKYGLSDESDRLPTIRPSEVYIETLTTEEIQLLIDCPFPRGEVAQSYYSLLISFLARTGRRSSEVQGLKVADLDFTQNIFIIRNPKNRRPRWIPIPLDLVSALEQLCKGKEGEDYVFHSLREGNSVPIGLSTMRHILYHRAKRVGIKKKVSPHKLRHSFPVELLRAGVPLPLVSELLGHINFSSTQKYIHLVVEDLRRASQLHPLNRKAMTPKQVVEEIKRDIAMRQLGERDDISVTVKESKGKFKIEIEWDEDQPHI